IKPDDFKHIEEYLQKLPQLIEETEQEKSISENDRQKQSFMPKIDAVFVSHSHYDHVSGLKKLITLNPDLPVFCSRITLDLFLLRDSNYLKQKNEDDIEEEEYQNIIKNVIYVENGDKIEFKDNECFLSFFHAGHMPGALMLLAKINDFRFLYTGDYTYYDITPFAGTKRFLEQISRPIDYLLIDGTAAREEYGNLSDQFHSLILFLEQKAEYEDNVLIGADPSSLAISFMLIFWRYFRKLQLRKGYTKRPNIYVDMMVRKNIQVINHRYEYIYGPISRLIRDKANPFNSIKFRWFDRNDLEFLRKKNNIIISHPPDLSYGLIRNIINVVGRNPHNLVFLAGAIHEQPGMDLISGGNEIEFSETWKAPFRAFLINSFMPQLKIKLHADKIQLAEMIKVLEPKEVCFFHQSAKKLIEVVKYVKELGVEKVSLPKKRKLLILN
ncbi:MAG: MBL fold metallo-hydrolase, partial [Promethearchaeota archaeon]